MKKTILSGILALLVYTGYSQSLNMNLLSTWADGSASAYNDISGYNAGGREYAIIGSNYATHYIDITDPQNPVHCDTEPGKNSNTVWRDIVIYQHYAYVVNDAGNGTLQIFDLQYLPDSVHKVYDNDEFTSSTHSCYRENDRLYLASNDVPSSGWNPIEVLSLADPEVPTLLGIIDHTDFAGSMHEVFVKNDTLYASAGFPGLYVFKVTDVQNPVLLQSFTGYPDNGYNHTAAVSPNNKYMCFTDEVPQGLSVKLYDISDLSNPVLKSTFYSNLGATAHNPFFVGDSMIVISYYHDGVWVWNIKDPTNPLVQGYYDTYPDNPGNYSGYDGCWGVFPYLTSRNIIGSDMTYGLFVMSNPYSAVVTSTPKVITETTPVIYPNPVIDNKLYIANMPSGTLNIEVYNVLGEKIIDREEYVNSNILAINELNIETAGVYELRISHENGFKTTKKLNYLR